MWLSMLTEQYSLPSSSVPDTSWRLPYFSLMGVFVLSSKCSLSASLSLSTHLPSFQLSSALTLPSWLTQAITRSPPILLSRDSPSAT